MKQDLKQKWIDALRSGKYQQGFHELRTMDEANHSEYKYCSFGVLCEVAINSNISGACYSYRFLQNELEVDFDETFKIIKMNDEQRASFNQIADYIEETLL